MTATLDRKIKSVRVMKESNTGVATAVVHMGSKAGWIATGIVSVVCAFLFGALLVGSFWISDRFKRYDDQLAELRQRDNVHNAQLTAIYMMAPSLKPKETDEKEK